jgi:hypothetical protein
MQNNPKKYEVLESLPSNGPMYIPIAENGEKFYQEGFVVRFFKSNGEDWVANFKPGWTDLTFITELPENEILIIAKGMGYIMKPDNETPIATFGISIRHIYNIGNDEYIAFDDTHAEIINKHGVKWTSDRISWDGIEEIVIKNEIVYGKSYESMSIEGNWIDFELDLKTQTLKGGSYNLYEVIQEPKRKWWQFWK